MLSRKKTALVAAIAATSFVPAAMAQTEWVGDVDQNYNNQLNWAGDMFPDGSIGQPGGNANINVGTGGSFPILSSDPAFTPNDIFIGLNTGNSGRLDHSAGLLSTGQGNWFFVGQNGGDGLYNMTGSASLNVGGSPQTGNFFVARNSGGDTAALPTSGVFNMNTTGELNTRGFFTGGNNAGTSAVTLDNGTINVLRFDNGDGTFTGGNFEVGSGFAGLSTGVNTFDMNGGTINAANELWLGQSGTTTTNITAGTINSEAWLVGAGRDGGSLAVTNMSGGTINAATRAGFFLTGAFSNSNGVFNMSGGQLNADARGQDNGIITGENGTGTLNLSGTADVNSGFFQIGNNDGAIGLVTVTGSNVSVDALEISLGLRFDGSGLVDTTGQGTLGFVADANGVSALNIAGDIRLDSPDGDFLTVDLSSYTGPYADILLIDGSAVLGEFTGLSQGDVVATGGTDIYTIDYTGGDVSLRAVPEPASLGLIGLAGLVLMRRRR